MYDNVTKADVSEIFNAHLLSGKLVERLLVPSDVW